jgi:hypothetical protein
VPVTTGVSREVAVPERDTDLDDMNPLQRLIVERMAERGWDPKEVEARGIPHATLHRYSNPLVLKAPPREKTIRQLATALHLDFGVVSRAGLDAVAWSHERAHKKVRALLADDATANTDERLDQALAAMEQMERDQAELRRTIEALKKEKA